MDSGKTWGIWCWLNPSGAFDRLGQTTSQGFGVGFKQVVEAR